MATQLTAPTSLSSDVGVTVASSLADTVARRFRLTCALDEWRGSARTVYGGGHALLLAFLRAVDLARAEMLHNSDQRKPWAISPLAITPRQNGIAVLTVDIACWSEQLAGPLADACTAVDG